MQLRLKSNAQRKTVKPVRTVEMPSSPRRKLMRALAVSQHADFGGRLIDAHRERMDKISRDAEVKLRAFMESIANKD